MAKRLTDTAKWKNPWFRALPTKYKVLFLYFLDECDNAGVLHLDWEMISFVLKEEFELNEFREFLGDKVVFLADDKIILRKFVVYQQNENSPMMTRHILKILDSHGIRERYEAGEFK